MVVRWEASVAAELKAEIKSAKTIYSTLEHYEEKVVSLQQKYTRQPVGTDAAQNLWSKLERNQHKLQEAAAEFSSCRDRLERLDKIMEHDWMLIFPLLVKLLQTEMDEAKERASVMALLEDSLREMSEAVQRHGVDHKVALSSLEMWSILYTDGVAAAPTVENAGVAADASTNAEATQRENANIRETSSAVSEDHPSVESNHRQQQLDSEHGLASTSGTTEQHQWTVQSSEEDRGAETVTQGISIPDVETTIEIGELPVPAAELINNDDIPQHMQRRIPVDPSVIVARDEIAPSPAVDQAEPPRQPMLDTGDVQMTSQHEVRGAGLMAQDMLTLAVGGSAEMDDLSVPAAELSNSDDSAQHRQRRIPVDPSVIVLRDEIPSSPCADQVEPTRQAILDTGNARVDVVANVTETPYTDSSPLPHQQRQPMDTTATGIRADYAPVEYQTEPLTPTTLGRSDVGEPMHSGVEEPFVVVEQEGRDNVLERDRGSSNGFFQPIDEAESHPLPIHLPSIEFVAEAVGNCGDDFKKRQVDNLQPTLEVEAASEASAKHFADTIDSTASIGSIGRGFEPKATDDPAFHGGSPKRRRQPNTDEEGKLFDHDAEVIDEFPADVGAAKPTVQNFANEPIDFNENISGDYTTEKVHTPMRGSDPPTDDEFTQYCYESDDNETELSCHTEADPTHQHPVSFDPEVLNSPLVDLRPVNDNLYAASEPGEIVDANVKGNAENNFNQAWDHATNESFDSLMEPNNHVDADEDDFADVLGAAALVDGSESLLSEFHSAAEVEEGSRIGYMC